MIGESYAENENFISGLCDLLNSTVAYPEESGRFLCTVDPVISDSLITTPATPTDDSAFTLNQPDRVVTDISSPPESISGVKRKLESKPRGGYVLPRHVRRSLECVETVLTYRNAVPVGHIVAVTCDTRGTVPGEIMNVQESPDGRIFYYIHYLNRHKREDDWVSENDIGEFSGWEQLKPKQEFLQQDSTIVRNAEIWSGFFQLSQLTKQTTAGSSAYAASASNAHHDPHEYSPKTIVGVQFGASRIKSWYRSPYPRQFWSVDSYMRVCDRCLAYGLSETGTHECPSSLWGSVVYEKNGLIVREVDGSEATSYCERLLLLSKLFLEDKRTSADETSQSAQVTPFLFYVLMEKAAGRERFVGYFSKYKVVKKDSPILSCILVMPTEQKKGFGKLLISISYELAKREGRQGSAERPLSGPGLAAFMSWWTWRLRTVVEDCYDGETLTVAQLSELSGMTSEDIVETLKNCGAVKQWGSAPAGDVKLRESGKRTKIKLTMDIMRALEKLSPRGRVSPNEFDAHSLSTNTRLCPVVQTPTK